MQAFAQIPDVEVYYGPDTYMGRNLAHLLQNLASCSDAEVCPVPLQLNHMIGTSHALPCLLLVNVYMPPPTVAPSWRRTVALLLLSCVKTSSRRLGGTSNDNAFFLSLTLS